MPRRKKEAPKVTVEGDASDFVVVEKTKPVKVKSSSFHITINTNQRYGSKDAIILDMRPLYVKLTEIFKDTTKVEKLIEIMEPNKEFSDVIGSVKTNIGIEYSEKAGLHAHCLFSVTHITKIRVNLPNLRSILDEALPHLPSDAPYVNVRFVPDQKQVVMNYVNKQVRGGDFVLREGMEFGDTPSCSCECKIGDMSQFFF